MWVKNTRSILCLLPIFELREQLCFEFSHIGVRAVGNVLAFNRIHWLWDFKVIETMALGLLSDFEARFEFS